MQTAALPLGADDLIDLDSPSVRRDPYPTYARLRAKGGLHRAGDNLWLVSGFSDVHQALMDPVAFSSALLGSRSVPYLIALDPPEHTRLRSLVMRAFTPSSITTLAPRIEALADELLTTALTRQSAEDGVDIVDTFANPLPVTVIGGLLGVPADRNDDLRRWSEASLRAGGGSVDPLGTQAPAAVKKEALALMHYLAGLIDQYARSPKDNLISSLVATHQEGDLTGMELVFFCQLLLIGGHMTTQHLIANGTALLATDPALWQRLQREPGLVPRFVEETLRCESPLQARLRVTTRAVELGGTVLPEGAYVLLLLGSANRDSARYPDGDRFDLDRPATGHVALGHGIHSCLGGGLARLEAAIAFRLLLKRLDHIELVQRVDAAERIGDALGLAWRGFDRLHVHLNSERDIGAVVTSLRVSPQVIVRAAAWPVRIFDELAAPACAAAARVDDTPTYRVAYDAAVAEGRRTLHALTIGDARFARALAVSNPELSLLAERLDCEAPRNKRARHLETTLFRTLSRAAARTEPCDLWAGVASADRGTATRVLPAPPRVLVAPDLRPFVHLFRQLAGRPQLRHAGLWKLNPTLRLDESDARRWLFWLPGHPRAVHRQQRASPSVDALVNVVSANAPASFEALCSAGREALGRDVDRELAACIAGGLLVGGLQFPVRFSSAWDALRQAGKILGDPIRQRWNQTIRQLLNLSRDLRATFHSASPASLRAAHSAARTAITDLASAFDVDVGELPRAPLRCDLGLGGNIELGPALIDALIRSLTMLENAGRPAALGTHFARLDADRFVCSGPRSATLSTAPPVPYEGALVWERLCAFVDGDQRFRDAIAHLSQSLAVNDDVVTMVGAAERPRASTPALLLCAPIHASSTMSLHGIADEVAPALARYGSFLAPAARWLAQELAALGEVFDLAAACDANVNALARPRCLRALSVLDPWGTTGACPRGATLAPNSAGQVRAHIPGVSNAAVVISLCSADVGANDEMVRALLTTSGRTAPVVSARGDSVVLESEAQTPRRSPSVELPDGTVVRRRRTVLTGPDLTQLLEGDAAARFRAWQQRALQHGWPTLLAVRRDGGPALMLHRDSPLAIEALFEGARGHTAVLVVEEPPDEAWLYLDGERHIAELAIPFARTSHSNGAPS